MPLTLSFDVNSSGLLRAVPSGSRRPLTVMTFRPDGVAVTAEGCPEVLLAWDTYGRLEDATDAKPPRDGWVISFWVADEAGRFGVAVRAGGTYSDLTKPIFAATTTTWRRFNRWTGPTLAGRSLPVLPGTTVTTKYEAEVATLSALCSILHDDEQLRQRLGDATRMTKLAHDMRDGLSRFAPPASGSGRDSTDIHVAMQACGFVHRYGRPLSAEGLPAADEVVRQVEAKLLSNSERTDRDIDHEQVERLVRRDYLDVKPWPFAALARD